MHVHLLFAYSLIRSFVCLNVGLPDHSIARSFICLLIRSVGCCSVCPTVIFYIRIYFRCHALNNNNNQTDRTNCNRLLLFLNCYDESWEMDTFIYCTHASVSLLCVDLDQNLTKILQNRCTYEIYSINVASHELDSESQTKFKFSFLVVLWILVLTKFRSGLHFNRW